MNNRKPIPRSELLYPHIVRQSKKGYYFVVNTATPNIDTLGTFYSHKDALTNAKKLNHLYLQSTGWYQREKRVHDNVKPLPVVTLCVTLVLILALVVRLLFHIPL